MIWPLLIALTGRYFASGLTKLMIIACVSAVCIVSVIRPEALPFFLVLPIPAFLALGCGALLAFRASYEHSSIVFPVLARVGLIALFLGAGICVSVLGLSGIWAAFAHIALICGIVLIVELATKGGWGWIGAFLRWRPLAFLGTVSYGFYVFHNFAPTIVNRLIRVGTLPTGSDVGLIAPVLNFSTTLILASLSWMILERPINQLKARFPYVSGTS